MNVNQAYKTVTFTVWIIMWNSILQPLPPFPLTPIFQTLCSGESETQSQIFTASFNSVKPSMLSSFRNLTFYTMLKR